MAINRDNDEERMARIEHILGRLAEGRANSQRFQNEARRVLSELQHSKERRTRLLDAVQSAVKPRRARRNR